MNQLTSIITKLESCHLLHFCWNGELKPTLFNVFLSLNIGRGGYNVKDYLLDWSLWKKRWASHNYDWHLPLARNSNTSVSIFHVLSIFQSIIQHWYKLFKNHNCDWQLPEKHMKQSKLTLIDSFHITYNIVK